MSNISVYTMNRKLFVSIGTYLSEIELGKNFEIPERWKFKGKWGIQI